VHLFHGARLCSWEGELSVFVCVFVYVRVCARAYVCRLLVEQGLYFADDAGKIDKYVTEDIGYSQSDPLHKVRLRLCLCLYLCLYLCLCLCLCSCLCLELSLRLSLCLSLFLCLRAYACVCVCVCVCSYVRVRMCMCEGERDWVCVCVFEHIHAGNVCLIPVFMRNACKNTHAQIVT